jgi:hypothetical protein
MKDKKDKKIIDDFEKEATKTGLKVESISITDKDKDLFGDDVDGKLLGMTEVTVSTPMLVPDVQFRRDGENYVLKVRDIKGKGKSIEQAVKEFKKAYKKA